MNEAEIRQRLSRGEDSATQFKRGPIDVAKLAAGLVAFTNAAGGVIFFGVDDNGEVCGLSRADAKSLDKAGAFWVKSGPDKRRVTAREELQRMLQASLLIHADELPMAGSSVKDIDLHHFGEFLERNYRIPLSDVLEPGKVDIPQMLSNLGFAAGAQLTLAGVMLFAKTPQRFAPVNVVKCVAFVGNSIAGTRYRDSEDFHGTLRDMYRATMSFVMRNIRHEQRGQGFNSIGIPIVPEDSVSELVANMFLHRDYFVSAPWRVLMFDDRMEIHSPGCLPNHQDIAKIKAGVSVARNPIIFTFATKEIPYRGIGSGIKRAIELYPHIEFENNVDANEFVAIIWYQPISAGRGGVNAPRKIPNETINETIKQSETINETINETIKNVPGISLRGIVEAVGKSRATVSRVLSALKESGMVEYRGSKKTGGYYSKGGGK